MVEKPKNIIGRADQIDLPAQGLFGIPAKIDTGAKTSALWASNIHERDGGLAFTLFGPGSPLFTGEEQFSPIFETVTVASSIGEEEVRYKVRLLACILGRKIQMNFTLADRSTQAYPILIGRNALRGKFVVDVQSGKADWPAERQRSEELQSFREHKGDTV